MAIQVIGLLEVDRTGDQQQDQSKDDDDGYGEDELPAQLPRYPSLRPDAIGLPCSQ